QRGITPAAQFFARQFEAGAEVVHDGAGVEVDGEVELVGEDAVGLVLEVRIAARNRPGGRIGGVGRQQPRGVAHERRQQIIFLRAAPAQGVVQCRVVGKLVVHDQCRQVGFDVIMVGGGAVKV